MDPGAYLVYNKDKCLYCSTRFEVGERRFDSIAFRSAICVKCLKVLRGGKGSIMRAPWMQILLLILLFGCVKENVTPTIPPTHSTPTARTTTTSCPQGAGIQYEIDHYKQLETLAHIGGISNTGCDSKTGKTCEQVYHDRIEVLTILLTVVCK